MNQLLDGAERLAESDATYYQITYVVRVDAAGVLTPYCRVADWPQTLAGQIAAKDQEIAALRAQIAALTAKQPAAEDETHACDVDGCDRTFTSRRALTMHRMRAHSPTPGAEPAAPAPIMLLDDDPTWRCTTCGSDAFSRSMTDPTRCMRCVKATNGAAVI